MGRLTEARKVGVSQKTKRNGNAVIERYKNGTRKAGIEIVPYNNPFLRRQKDLEDTRKNIEDGHETKTSSLTRNSFITA